MFFSSKLVFFLVFTSHFKENTFLPERKPKIVVKKVPILFLIREVKNAYFSIFDYRAERKRSRAKPSQAEKSFSLSYGSSQLGSNSSLLAGTMGCFIRGHMTHPLG